MNIIFFVFVSLISNSLCYQVNEKESIPLRVPLRPGDLLRSLDELTSDAELIYTPLNEPLQKPVERRLNSNPLDQTGAGSEYDYDKAYENFVSKYFAKGEEDLDSEDTNEKSIEELDDDVATYEYSDEVDDTKPEDKSSNSKICKRVKIDDQNCIVCEDPKTNEKSKSCSYSSDSKPKNYGYSKEKSRKHSKNDDEDEEDDISEEARSVKRETKNKNDRITPRRTNIKAFLKPENLTIGGDSESKCTRKKENGMICFYCGSISENSRECIADKYNPKKSRLDEFSKKNTTAKKVFKRMVTYSFKDNSKPKIKAKTYAAFKEI